MISMRITLIAYGTRGDVQPILALGKGLARAGHAVRVVASRDFATWVASHGLLYSPIHVDIRSMMESDEGVAWVEARTPMQAMRMMRQLFEQTGVQAARDMLESAKDADVLVGGFTSDCFASAIAQKLGIRYLAISLQPLYPTQSGAATPAPVRPHADSLLNRWAGLFAERVLYSVFGDSANAFRRELGLPSISRQSYFEGVHRLTQVCGFSAHVVPRPSDYPANLHITGYWFLDEGEHWQPPEELVRFLAAGPPPVYVGFGSAASSDARGSGEMVVRALRQTGQRGILAQGWAGLSHNDTGDDVLVVSAVPHLWLFPRMAGVIHHGGAGTTAAAFRAGVPQFVVPHFVDQPYWARRTHELGVGVKPVDKLRLTERALVAGIETLVTNPGLRETAARLGAMIQAEDGVAAAVEVFERFLRRER